MAGFSTTSGTGDIGCPYFVSHSPTSIICQSDIPDAKTQLNFPNKQAKSDQQRIFCEKHYKKCPHYINIVKWGWEANP